MRNEGCSFFLAVTLQLESTDPMGQLPERAWKSVLSAALARTNEGLVLCDRNYAIVHATSRARHLLERLGAPRNTTRVPPEIIRVIEEPSDGEEGMRTGRIVGERGAAMVRVHVDPVTSARPAQWAIWLREDILRDEQLYGLLEAQYGITRRQFQLAQLLRRGLSNRDIAQQLRLTEATVKVYLHELYRACGVPSRTALVARLLDMAGPG